MEGEVITKAGGLFTFGLLFIYLGLHGWKDRRKKRISPIKAANSKAGKQDTSLPDERWDRVIAYVQPVLMLLFGPAMLVTGLHILFSS